MRPKPLKKYESYKDRIKREVKLEMKPWLSEPVPIISYRRAKELNVIYDYQPENIQKAIHLAYDTERKRRELEHERTRTDLTIDDIFPISSDKTKSG